MQPTGSEQRIDARHPPPLQQLPHGLHRLIEDCFDEEQYDHAISLIDQLRAESIRPSSLQIRNLFALSLCSLPRHPQPVASSSKTTLDAPVPVLANLDPLAKLSRSRHRPSHYAISTASRLLLQMGKSWLHPTVASAERIAAQDAQMARYILQALPSYANEDGSNDNDNGNDNGNGNTGSRGEAHQADSVDLEMLGQSTPLARWVRERFETAEDVWDLLSGGQTALDDPRSQQSRLVDEFWLSERERNVVIDHVEGRSRGSAPQRTATEGGAITEGAADGEAWDGQEDPFDDYGSDSDEAAFKDRRMPKHRRAAPASARQTKIRRTTRATAGRNGGKAGAGVEEEEDDDDDDDDPSGRAANLRLTDGAWRTLRVLVELWQSESMSHDQRRSCFTEQFPPSEHRRRLLSSPWRQQAKSGVVGSDLGSSEVRKALDIAFSFASSVPTLWWKHGGGYDRRQLDCEGADRHRAERGWRQREAEGEREDSVQRRVEAASSLLALILAHGKRGLLDKSAVIRGTALRLAHLDLAHVRCLTIKLQRAEPGMLVQCLLAYLALISTAKDTKKRNRKKHGDDDKDDDEVMTIQLHGESIEVRRRFTDEGPSADRLLSALKRGARGDAVLAKVRSWLEDPANVSLQPQANAFVPTGDDAGNGGLPWTCYRALSVTAKEKRKARTQEPPVAAPAPAEGDATAYRVAALLRLHTITEACRTAHVKWFILLCLLEMHQQAHTAAEVSLSQPLARLESEVGESDVAAMVDAIETSLERLDTVLSREVREMQTCIEAMQRYGENEARTGQEEEEESPCRDLSSVAETMEGCRLQLLKVREIGDTLEALRQGWKP
ncbi:hypothetical protein ACQY0O_001841 [Thecaphora frezii]